MRKTITWGFFACGVGLLLALYLFYSPAREAGEAPPVPPPASATGTVAAACVDTNSAVRQPLVLRRSAVRYATTWTFNGALSGNQLPIRTVAQIPAGILIDASSGRILWSKSVTMPLQIASMTKMMTVLLAMEAVERGELTLDTVLTTTLEASKVGGSQIYLKVGETFTLAELLKTIMMVSANDAAHLVAARVAGSINAFVARMNERARQLGMQQAHFYNVHGLPMRAGRNTGSALDMAKVAHALLKYPDVLCWSSTWTDTIRSGTFALVNHNPLVKTVDGVDGLKTGYYSSAGYSITLTALRNGRRCIAVVIGVPNKQTRNAFGAELLEWGFKHSAAPQTYSAVTR